MLNTRTMELPFCPLLSCIYVIDSMYSRTENLTIWHYLQAYRTLLEPLAGFTTVCMNAPLPSPRPIFLFIEIGQRIAPELGIPVCEILDPSFRTDWPNFPRTTIVDGDFNCRMQHQSTEQRTCINSRENNYVFPPQRNTIYYLYICFN